MSVDPIQVPVAGFQVMLSLRDFALSELGATATATSTATTSGEELIDLTPDKLVTQDLDSAWRSGALASLASGTIISTTIDLGTARPVDLVVLCRHNVRVPFRVELYKTNPSGGGATAENLAEFTCGVWFDPIIRAAVGDFDWPDMPWSLGPSLRKLDAMQSLHRIDTPYLASRVYYGIRYVRISYLIEDASNTGVDYLQVSHAIVGRVFRPAVNMLIGWQITPDDRSETRRLESGAKRGRRKSKGRVLAFGFGYLDRKEAFDRILDEVLEAGKLGLVFAWPEPEHRRYFYQQAIVGQIADALPSVAMAQLEVPAAQGFVVEEAE